MASVNEPAAPVYQPRGPTPSVQRSWRAFAPTILAGALVLVLPPTVVGLALGAEEAGLVFLGTYVLSASAATYFVGRRLAQSRKQSVGLGALTALIGILLPLPLAILLGPVSGDAAIGVAAMPLLLLGFGIVAIPIALVTAALAKGKRSSA